MSLDLFIHSYVTASLGSITDTLNFNGDFTQVNVSLVEERDVGKLRTIAQEALRSMRGLTVAGRVSGIRTENDHV